MNGSESVVSWSLCRAFSWFYYSWQHSTMNLKPGSCSYHIVIYPKHPRKYSLWHCSSTSRCMHSPIASLHRTYGQRLITLQFVVTLKAPESLFSTIGIAKRWTHCLSARCATVPVSVTYEPPDTSTITTRCRKQCLG